MIWLGSILKFLTSLISLKPKTPAKEIAKREEEETDWKTVNADKKQFRMMVNFLVFCHNKEQKLRGEEKTTYQLPEGSTVPNEYWKKKKEREAAQN